MVTARAPAIDCADLKCCGLTPAHGGAGSGRGTHEKAPITSGTALSKPRGQCCRSAAAWMVRVARGLAPSQETAASSSGQGPGCRRATRSYSGRRPSAHDWAGQAPDAAAARRMVPPVRVHPRSAGLHVTGRQPPVPIGAPPGLRQLQPSPRPRQSHPCRLPSSEPLGGVARRSDTNVKVAADFQRRYLSPQG